MAIATKSSSKPQPFRSLIEKARNIHCRKENIPKNVEPRCKSDSKFTKSFPPKKKKYWQGTFHFVFAGLERGKYEDPEVIV